ncbi:hypothetical protein ABL78_3745 [Leptomonas seymouri]|uniref:Uncharacterized protein n=1 Tax=Leptomonas seymouri TaxID=5684 RepID=A0A0N1PEJ9_LEPSE|nr:hypothetical protein ABL78_3745 [Leptomonas seymouri]|eukprot:KPI87183.1 hypothetical protein ABL78_3745 [Leptomonas seymouri]
MSNPSLASEISKLHELLKLGALTAEEFNAAKQATIRSFMSSTAVGPSTATTSMASEPSAVTTGGSSPSPPLGGPHVSDMTEIVALPNPAAQAAPALSEVLPAVAAAPARSREEWQRLWSASPLRLPPEHAPSFTSRDAVDVRMQSLRCAERLFHNLQAYPTEAKYKRIREANKIVAQQLLPVEASAALLRFAGFIREEEEAAPSNATAVPVACVDQPSYVWVQRDDPAETARKASAACRLVSHLLEYMGEQQSRRLGLQQLRRSVALEVRLERAAREVAAGGDHDVLDASSEADEGGEGGKAEAEANRPMSLSHPFFLFLVECYTIDEAGDGLYSSLQHLLILQRLYDALRPATTAAATASAARSPSSYSLLETAEIYGAVVQQRGAIELLLYGCGAQIPLFPVAVRGAPAPPTKEDGGDIGKASPSSSPSPGEPYIIELLPPHIRSSGNPASHVARCVWLIKRLQREVELVRGQRAKAAREAAEVSMRRELQRERQRQQLERSHMRSDMDKESQSLPRRVRVQDAQRCTSSSSTSSESRISAKQQQLQGAGGGGAGGGGGEGRRRIPIREALAILMGKRNSSPTRASAAPSLP